MTSEKLYKAFIYLILFLFALSVLIPVFWVITASIKENSEFYASPWTLPKGFNFENFTSAWREAEMGSYFLNSLTVTILSLVILLCTAIPCAYALSRFHFRLRRAVRALIMGGLFVNVSYIVVPIFLMLVGLNGIFDTTLFLNNKVVLSVVYAATALPFTVYLLSGYFESLSREYEEAAYVDGCSHFRTMVSIMVPLARPAVITVILFNSLSFWNEYIIALTLMTDDRAKTLPVGLMNLMKAQNAAAQYGRMYAGLVIVMIPTLVLYILLQKKLTEGMSVGGIKG
ncbi:MAG: carbohydrate ABC transporter permease [Clostridia bacterium]|nr:carbohydrate ABC transporter permease [Clostridia bacterium]